MNISSCSLCKETGETCTECSSSISYQCREIGESNWQDCSFEWYEQCSTSPHMDTRVKPAKTKVELLQEVQAMSDKMHDEFEAFCRTKHWDCSYHHVPGQGRFYTIKETYYAWIAWQEAGATYRAEIERIADLNHKQFGDAIRQNAEIEKLRKECARLADDNRALLENPGDAL